MEHKKLKPCPFCGGEAEIVKRYGITNDDIYAYAVCSVCGMSTRVIVINAKNSVEEKIAEFWNKRSAELGIPKQVINNSYDIYFCPNCHKAVWQNKNKSNYCFRCGQKLLWCVHDNPKLLEVEK